MKHKRHQEVKNRKVHFKLKNLTKHSVKNNQHAKKDSNAFSRKELFIFGGALAVYLFFMKSLNVIINYPNIILYLGVGIIFVIIFLYSLP